MSKFTLRRGRILPGPLTPLSERTPRSGGVLVAPLAATALAVTAILFLLPQQGTPGAAEPVQTVPVAERIPEAVAAPVAAQEATPVPSPSPVEAAQALPVPEQVAAAAPALEPIQPAKAAAPAAAKPTARPVTAKSAAGKPAVARHAAAGSPASDPSPFRLDLLPVLQTEDVALDLETAPGLNPAPARAAKPASRRTAGRNAGTASEPSQP